MEVELADVVLAYLDHLEARGELDLETATEFLVLVAALLELKSRLLLPSRGRGALELEPGEAAEELLARLLDAHRYRGAADHLAERLERESRHRIARRRCRASCAAPIRLRRAPSTARRSWARRSAACCASRRSSTCATSACRRSRSPSASAPARAAAPRAVHVRRRRPRGGSRDDRGDALRAAGALQARRGDVEPGRALRGDRHRARGRGGDGGCGVSELARIVEALLFLSPEPVALADLAAACEAEAEDVEAAIAELEGSLAGRGHRAAAHRRRLRAGDRSGGRGGRAAPVVPAADAAAHPGAGRDARDRRLPAARVAAGDHAHPRRERRLRDRHAARARA